MRAHLIARLVLFSSSLWVIASTFQSPANAVCGQSIAPAPRPEAAIEEPALPAEVSAILKQHCWKCHSAESKAAGLNLQSLESLLLGGESGPVVRPGSTDDSVLLAQLAADSENHMPPMGQLNDDEIETLSRWIKSLSPELIPQREEQPSSTSLALPDDVPISLAIDLLIHKSYSEQSIPHASRCNDETFVRRIYLDLTGRIPTVEELASFGNETDSRKREQLIDRLLNSDRYAQRMANAFDTMLMGRNERKLRQRTQQGWRDYLTESFHKNSPWNAVAKEILLARPVAGQRGHLWYLYERENNHQEIAESIAKGFFGVDIACAQCHDHPLASEIKQAHYWGLVAFYKRTKNEKENDQIILTESAIGGFDDYANALKGTTDSAVLTFLGAETVSEDRPADPAQQEDSEQFYISIDGTRVPKFSRREKFVQEIVTDHPLLARAMVNRVWGLLMGRGLVHPIEKMDSTYPASHPELLDWLCHDFETHHYDVKRLVRGIVSSQAYQLNSTPPSTASPNAESSFSYALVRPLSAESMLSSLETALAIEIPANSDAAKQWRTLFPEIVPEHKQTTLKQALLLTNYPELNQLIQQAAAKEMADSPTMDAVRVEKLFLQVFGRKPTEPETQALLNFAGSRSERPTDAVAQILWAMVTSAEFRFNH